MGTPSLLDRSLLINTGKGGVGKTTITAALALVAASRGKRVLVCELNTKERISTLLGAREVGAEVGPIAERIDGIVVRPAEAMREYALMKLKFRAIYHAVFENRIVSRFLRFVPSLPELVMLGKILFCVREARWDLVIVDAPATGHALTFLRIPQAIIDTVPPGNMRSDAEWMRDILVDPARTAVDIVSLPEEMPVNESLMLAQQMRDVLEMSIGHVFLNATRPPVFDAEDRRVLDAAQGSDGVDPRLAPALEAARAHTIRADLSIRYHDRLEQELGRPIVDLPLLFPKTKFGRADVERIAATMDAAVA